MLEVVTTYLRRLRAADRWGGKIGVRKRGGHIQEACADSKDVVLQAVGVPMSVRGVCKLRVPFPGRLHQARFHLVRGKLRVLLQQESGSTADHRRCHAGSAQPQILCGAELTSAIIARTVAGIDIVLWVISRRSEERRVG